ncbi:MAG TPA: zinc ABC transporter substrate-binding protein [Gammaproteobacteria bacterium]|nr:zinc ABC transporter substrate-binding protein [Gammaproteobacteria bacterium]
MPKFATLALLTTLLSASTSMADVSIAATIKPLQLIAREILGEKGSVSVLLAGNSPHSYALTPSDRIALDNADLVLWVGKELETFIEGAIDQLQGQATVLTVLEMQDLNRLNLENAQLDPHVWLDTRNALQIARAISRELEALDGENKAVYRQNLASFQNQMDATEEELLRVTASLLATPFIVHHNAYQYFEQQIGLEHEFALVLDPEMQPGIRQILNVRELIQQSQPGCLLLEPDSNQAAIDTFLSGYELTQITVDLLGNQGVNSREGYSQLMLNLADAFISCLTQQ